MNSDKMITGFFVLVLGALWFFTRRYEVPHRYRIIVYDLLGNRVEIDNVRTLFETRVAAISFARQYSDTFSHYDFVLESELPRLRLWFLRFFQR